MSNFKNLFHKFIKLMPFFLMVGFVMYLVVRYDFSGIGRLISKQWVWLWPATISLSIFSRFINSYQLSGLFSKFGMKISPTKVFINQLVSSFSTLFLPGNAAASGLSWYMFSRSSDKKIQIAGCLAFNRIVQILSVILFSSLAMLADSSVANNIGRTYIIICLASSILGLLLLHSNLNFFSKYKWLPVRIRLFLQNAMIHGRRHLPRQLAWSIVLIIMGAINTAFALKIAEIHLSVYALFWIPGILTIIYLLPITVAGIGVRELTLITLLQSWYGISPENSLMLSLVSFCMSVVVFGILGAASYLIMLRA